MFQKLFVFCNLNRGRIIKLFQVVYFLLSLWALFSAWAISLDNSFVPFTYEIGKDLGIAAAIVFLLVTIPGIFGRFGFKHPLITIGIMFRRYLGILMFVLGLYHGLIVYELPTLAAHGSFFDAPLNVWIGISSLTLAFPLFLTSNNWSMQKLGKNWKKLHKLVYLIFWTIVLHVALVEEMTITISVAIIGIFEILSLLYDWKKKSQLVPLPTPTNPI